MKYIYSKAFKTLSNMEHHAQSIDDALIGGLSYKLKAGASYVTNRRSVTYFAQGGNSYSSHGVKVMKFHLTGDQWMDPSTFHVMLQVNNRDAEKPLKAVHWNPAVMFSRMRLLAGGSVVEDVSDANRLSLMLDALTSSDERTLRHTQGFAIPRDATESYDWPDVIDANTSRIVMFKPLFGLFKQEKLIPLRYCPLQIELELVSSMTDAFVNNDGTHVANWDVTDIQCKLDLLTLDHSLENEYASHLLSGKSLPINFSTWNHTNQSTGNDKNFSAHISRSLTRLKSIFITLQTPNANAEHSHNKHVNQFWHPMITRRDAKYGFSAEHQVQVQIGSKLYPEYPISGLAEAMSQLRKAVGNHFYIPEWKYRGYNYIIGIDTEKVPGAGFTGINTKNGELLTINFKNCVNLEDVGTNTALIPSRVFAALHYDAVLNIKSEGVEVLE